jgi:hypothetical protein
MILNKSQSWFLVLEHVDRDFLVNVPNCSFFSG